MIRTLLTLAVVACLDHWVVSLDNGLALTPPMGWMTWQRFRCTIDCNRFPNECISESLVKRTADRMSSDGYLKAGYEYLIVDDCWLAGNRSTQGHLLEDPKRFPNGIKALADYVHSKGLKFGIYQDYGTRTCGGYPGMQGHIKSDVNQFAQWGVDYIKVDGCYYTGSSYEKDYEELRYALNNTGRPIVYSCSYPAYQNDDSTYFDYEKLAENCNLWRNFDDIDDSWASVTSILDYFALKQEHITQFAGPGHWNDPDMLLVGNFGLSEDQSEVQMALWAVLAAPLLMSTDLDTIKPHAKQLLLNDAVVAVNQDPLGIPGLRVLRENKIEVWRRPVVPSNGDNYSYALAFYSRRTDGMPFEMNVTLSKLGLLSNNGYQITDLIKGVRYPGSYFPTSNISVRVNPTGVVFLKAMIIG